MINEKGKCKIADCHVHTRQVDYDKTAKMFEDLEETGVTEICIMSMPYRTVAENLFGLFMKKFYKKVNVRTFGHIHTTDRYATIAPEVQVKALLALGVDGIKLMFNPNLRKFYGRGPDDPYYDPMFDMLEERGIPVLIHLVDPEDFWEEGKRYGDGTFPSKEQMYQEAFRMLDKHPNLRVCFAHFMFLSNFPEEAERVMETYPNVRFDLTPGMEMYRNFDSNIERWKDFFEKYSTRILFGTDCNTPKKCNKELERLVYRKLVEKERFIQNCYGRDHDILGLGLSEDVVQQICYENYFDFVGKEAKTINKELYIQCCQRILADLEREPNDDFSADGGPLITALLTDPGYQLSRDFCKMAIKKMQDE